MIGGNMVIVDENGYVFDWVNKEWTSEQANIYENSVAVDEQGEEIEWQ